MLTTSVPPLPDKVGSVRYPVAGKYGSFRIDTEVGWGGTPRFKILVTYRNQNVGGERRLAGCFQSVEHAEKYIARFLPEFLDCAPQL